MTESQGLLGLIGGVRQGCILSPRLFNLFINDIPELFDNTCRPVTLGDEKISCLMYADDLVILSETESGIQNCLDKLKQYTDKWKLELNIKKTKIMVFQNTGRRRKTKFYFGTQILELAQSYKYLGTTITNTGSFKLNEVNLKKKGLRAAFIISKNIGMFAAPSSSIRVFEKVVEPILTYNGEVGLAFFPKTWDIKKFTKNMWDIGKEINKVVLNFLRQVLGVHKKTTNIAILTETGKHPIAIKVFVLIMKFWVRLHTTEHKLLIAAHKLNLEQDMTSRQSWTRIVSYLVKVTGTNARPSNDQKKNNKIIKSFKTNLLASFEDWWQEQTTTDGKLDFFFKHKKTFTYEKYLDTLPRHLRMYVTRMRTSSHNLPVETLRYTKKKIKREERKCNICNLGEVGDEYHYLLRCNNVEIQGTKNVFMQKIRVDLPWLSSFSNENIIQYCLNMADDSIHFPIARYMKSILQKYREENEEKKIEPITHTRSGRLVKKPIKLTL